LLGVEVKIVFFFLIVADLDAAGGSGLVYFPSNKGWRGPLSLLEIVDKRKGTAHYLFSPIFLN
jgi:hypothetical protein